MFTYQIKQNFELENYCICGVNPVLFRVSYGVFPARFRHVSIRQLLLGLSAIITRPIFVFSSSFSSFPDFHRNRIIKIGRKARGWHGGLVPVY